MNYYQNIAYKLSNQLGSERYFLTEFDYSREIIHIFDVYKINKSSSVVEVKYYGNWSEEAGRAELLVSNDVMWKRRRDLKGYHIR